MDIRWSIVGQKRKVDCEDSLPHSRVGEGLALSAKERKKSPWLAAAEPVGGGLFVEDGEEGGQRVALGGGEGFRHGFFGEVSGQRREVPGVMRVGQAGFHF